MKKALLIPGLGGTSDCWSPLFTGRLSTQYNIESSPLPFSGTTIQDYAKKLIPEYPVDLLVGFSIGSAVVQEMIVLEPDIASKVVLMAPPAGNDFPGPPNDTHNFSEGRGKWSISMLEMMFTPDWLAAHPDVSEFFPRTKYRIPEEQLINQNNSIDNWEGSLKKLNNVIQPVLVLAGRYDIITPLVHAEAITMALPKAKLAIFDTGHGFPWQCPVETADKILEFK